MKACLTTLALFTLLTGLSTPHLAAQSKPSPVDFVNYETGQVHPLSTSADGRFLYVLNTPDSRLAVFSLAKPEKPVLTREIKVGLEPVSVRARNTDELWVVENLSDAVSVVSLKEGRVVATIHVGDEPNDIVFAGSPLRAFVSVSGEDLVRVYDPESRKLVGEIPILAKHPRALAVDNSGRRVFVLSFHSGNRTSLVPIDPAPAPPAPENPKLPPPPKTSLIISLDDPEWRHHPMNLVDYDLFEIDAGKLVVTRKVPGVGTTNFDLAYDARHDAVLVANADSRNRIRFEPAVNGHVIDNRLTRVTLGPKTSVQYVDVNAGVDYNVLPNPEARRTALADLTSVIVDRDGMVYATAQGTDRIAVLNDRGQILRRIEVSEAPADGRDTARKRGPRALALHPQKKLLYSYNRLSHSISVVDYGRGVVVEEVSIGFDPTPEYIRHGRRFLYEARIAGNGTMSCASCHIDGDADLLVWDLGNPKGELQPVPKQEELPFMPPGSSPEGYFHPMKGPMVTQTLRGLNPNPPFHWRGDKEDLTGFNVAFESLHGGAEIPYREMKAFEKFLLNIAHPPNPHRGLDNSLNEAARRGEYTFHNVTAIDFPDHTLVKCVDCHSNPDGANNHIFMPVSQAFIGIPQPINTPQLRGIYRRGEAKVDGSPSKVGFGYANDGNFPTLRAFLDLVTFNAMPDEKKDDLAEFIRAWDTGTAPAVGFRHPLSARAMKQRDWRRTMETLEWQAALGHIDLIADGVINGRGISLLFDPEKRVYLCDRDPQMQWSRAKLEILAAQNGADLIFTGVADGCGHRMALDRDRDGVLDREERLPMNAQETGKVHFR